MTSLKLSDFFQHPRVTEILELLVQEKSGLIVVAGPDGHTPLPGGHADQAENLGILPSGRKVIFTALMENILQTQKGAVCVYVTSTPHEHRPARSLKSSFQVLSVEQPNEYGGRIAQALTRKPGLLVIDWLNEQSATMALSAAQQGFLVLTQYNSLLFGAALKGQIARLGVDPERIGALRWAVSVRRIPVLCAKCRQALSPSPVLFDRLQETIQQSPESLAYIQNPVFYTPGSCPSCHHSGYNGDQALCDMYLNSANLGVIPYGEKSLLPLQSYLAYLAVRGSIGVQDWLEYDTLQTQKVYELFSQRDQALDRVNAQRDGKLAELAAANRVLEQRTRALVTLQNIAQTLLATSSLPALAEQICKQVCELCNAERAVLYYLFAPDQVRILAVNGWRIPSQPAEIAAPDLPGFQAGMKPYPFRQMPPGLDNETTFTPSQETLSTGLCVPLVAQTIPVGWVMIHSSQKAVFLPNETALLQTFASQAAIVLQRAGLVAQLEARITDLQAAQQELAQKERLEHELELARQVQQSVLPKIFPHLPGFKFGAENLPARQVGGDFYDVFRLDDDHFGLAIADVSDKGMPAALYMTLTRSLLLAEGRRSLAPLQVLHSVNRLLLDSGSASMFVTLFYAVLERSTRRMRYVRAGQDRPLLARAGVILELGGTGMPLGLFDEQIFQPTEEEIELQSGDRLVLYTDGLVDLDDPGGKNFERQNLIRLVNQHAHLPPGDICTNIFLDLQTFQSGSEQTDDMTILVMEVE